MSKHSAEDYSKRIAESARHLLSATSDIAEDSVKEARLQLEAALDSGKNAIAQAKDWTTKSLSAADGTVRENPYALAGIVFALGVLTAFAFKCTCTKKCDKK